MMDNGYLFYAETDLRRVRLVRMYHKKISLWSFWYQTLDDNNGRLNFKKSWFAIWIISSIWYKLTTAQKFSFSILPQPPKILYNVIQIIFYHYYKNIKNTNVFNKIKNVILYYLKITSHQITRINTIERS